MLHQNKQCHQIFTILFRLPKATFTEVISERYAKAMGMKDVGNKFMVSTTEGKCNIPFLELADIFHRKPSSLLLMLVHQ